MRAIAHRPVPAKINPVLTSREHIDCFQKPILGGDIETAHIKSASLVAEQTSFYTTDLHTNTTPWTQQPIPFLPFPPLQSL